MSAKGVVDVNTFLIPSWRRSLPVRADNQVVACLGACRAAADVAKVIGIAIDQLDGVVAFLFHRRHRNHQWLGAQVRPEHRVGGIAVRCDHRCVLIGRHAMFVFYLVEGRFKLTGRRVYSELVHHRVVHHQGKAIDEALLGNRLRLLDARRGHTGSDVLLFRLRDRVVLVAASGDQGRCNEKYASTSCKSKFGDSLTRHPLFRGAGLFILP